MAVLARLQSEAVVGLAADAGPGARATEAEEPPARVQVAIEGGVLIFDLEKLGVIGEGAQHLRMSTVPIASGRYIQESSLSRITFFA